MNNPKPMIKEVKQILRAFIWKRSDLISNEAKVALEHADLPKTEKGLGIKSIERKKKVGMLKHLWHLGPHSLD